MNALMTRSILGCLWFLCAGVNAQESVTLYILDLDQILLPGETTSPSGDAYPDDGLSYRWDLGDGRELSGAEVAVSYATPGAYKLTLQALNAESAVVASFTKWVFVDDPLAEADFTKYPPFAFIDDPLLGETFPLEENICFEGAALDGEDDAVMLYWEFGDGTVAETAESLKKRYTTLGTFEVVLWARDASGLTSYDPDVATIGIYGDIKPPDGRIISPIANREYADLDVHEIRVGQPLQFEGEVLDVEDFQNYAAYWEILGENAYRAEGFHPEAMVLPADRYLVRLGIIDPEGHEDLVQDEILVWIRDDNHPPENVTIVEPYFDPILMPGEGIDLSASGYDFDDDPLTFEWEISDGRRFSGPFINHVEFVTPGLYAINLIAKDSFQAEGKAEVVRYVMVNGGSEDCPDDPPYPIAVTPTEQCLAGPKGLRLNFKTGWETYPGLAVNQVFWDFSRGITRTGIEPETVKFEKEGWHPVRVFIENECGNWNSDWPWSVYIYGDNIPPEVEITAPIPNTMNAYNQPVYAIPLGETVTLAANATDPDGNVPLSFSWGLFEHNQMTDEYDYRVHSLEANPPPLAFTGLGSKQVDLVVRDSRDLAQAFARNVEIQVIDASLEPESTIIFPDGDFTVEPGVPVFFEGFVEDPNHLAATYSWDFGPHAEPSTATGPWVEGVVFKQPSPEGQPYVVRLTAKTEFSQETTPAEIRVTVKSFSDLDFEPNNSFSQAAPIQQGIYNHLNLDEDDNMDIYRFEVVSENRDVILQVNAEAQAVAMTLFQLKEGEWQSYPLDIRPDRANSVTLQDLPVGSYAMVLTQTTAGKRAQVSYGLSISTLQPSQFLPFIVADENLRSNLGVINPNLEPVFVQAVGLGADGKQVADIGFTLEAGERRYLPSLNWFNTQNSQISGSDIRWVRLSSEKRLVSYMVTESMDGTQLMSSGGITSLSDEVLIPHIANPDNGWYTRAVVVNGRGASEDLEFKSPNINLSIANMAGANSQQDFRFKDRVSGALPEWGQFQSKEKTVTLAGVEVFGRTDSKRQMSAIEMINTQRNNPNFLYMANDLYFAHIASDTQLWWTGISLINTDLQPANYQIVGYDRLGNELVRLPVESLPPGGKVLKTSQQIFGDLAVDWMKVEADERIAGFELFGDPSLNKAAGFKAANFVTDELFFPHVAAKAPKWTGISLVNVASTPTDIRIQAYTNKGLMVGEVSFTMDPFCKELNLVQNLFGPLGMPDGTAYLRVVASQKAICGFELFGNLTPSGAPSDQLAGLAAIPF